MTPQAQPVSHASEGDRLRTWVSEHKVCWEVAPHFEMRDQNKTATGSELTLLAQPSKSCNGDPGNLECYRVYQNLREIAVRALPKDARCHVYPFDASFHLRSQTGWQREVQLTVELGDALGAHGSADTEDDLRKAEAVLKRLGVCPGTCKPH